MGYKTKEINQNFPVTKCLILRSRSTDSKPYSTPINRRKVTRVVWHINNQCFRSIRTEVLSIHFLDLFYLERTQKIIISMLRKSCMFRILHWYISNSKVTELNFWQKNWECFSSLCVKQLYILPNLPVSACQGGGAAFSLVTKWPQCDTNQSPPSYGKEWPKYTSILWQGDLYPYTISQHGTKTLGLI